MAKSKQTTEDFPNATLEELDIIDKIAKRLAGRYRFGYNDVEDIEQQARIIALMGLKDYDGVRPLENFLWVHVKNRLYNFRRDNFLRIHGACEKCNESNGACTKYEQIEDCPTYQEWYERHVAKLNLLYPLEFSCVDDKNENNMVDNIDASGVLMCAELENILNKYIPLEHRHTYLRLRYGYRVATQYKIPLLQLMHEIIKKYYLCEEKNDC